PQPSASGPVTRTGLALEQHLSPAFDRIGARRRGLYCDLVSRDSGLGQSGGNGLGAIECSTEAVQLLGRSAAGPGIADAAPLAGVSLIEWQAFPRALPILVAQVRCVGRELDLGNRRAYRRNRRLLAAPAGAGQWR